MSSRPNDPEPDEVPTPGSTNDADLHDSDLIAWTLALSPEQRLAVLQDFVETFWTPQNG